MVRAEAGIARTLVSPAIGLLDAGLEGYLGLRGTAFDAGIRALFQVPYLGLGTGIELDVPNQQFNWIVTARSPLRRRGILTPGGLLRINWYPMESHGFTVGLSLPFGDPLAGRTRPIRDYVIVSNGFALPKRSLSPGTQIDAALDSLRMSATWIRKITAPFLDQDGRDIGIADARAGAYLSALRARLAVRSSEAEMRFFHAQLERAFALATGSDSLARTLAALARRTLLDEVLIPYNSLLGQQKRHDELVELGIAARGRFSRVIAMMGIDSRIPVDPALYVFQCLTEMLETERARLERVG